MVPGDSPEAILQQAMTLKPLDELYMSIQKGKGGSRFKEVKTLLRQSSWNALLEVAAFRKRVESIYATGLPSSFLTSHWT
jgi:uncharacterized glyoxalase superfamily metalloenzyme YdcJ